MKKGRLSMIAHVCFALIMLTMIVVILIITSDTSEQADSATAKALKQTGLLRDDRRAVLVRSGEVHRKRMTGGEKEN